MSATVTINQQFLTRLNNAGGARIAKASIEAVGDLIVADAKQNAPADLGTIRQQIGKETIGDKDKVRVVVFSRAPESPFQEFGTGGRVDIPTDMADMASQFKGQSGGDFKAFVLALTGWVRRHGLTGVYSVTTRKRSNAAKFGGKQGNADADEQAAYLIARSILKNGLKPQPFLYPAFVKNSPKLLTMLKEAFSQIMRSPQSYF